MGRNFADIDWSATAAWVALFMSLLTWLFAFVRSRKSIEITIKSFDVGTKGNDCDTQLRFFYVIIENKSRLSISITNISLLYNGDIYPCTIVPVEMMSGVRTRNSQVVAYKAIYSFQFPINIPGLYAESGYLIFESHQHTFPADAKQVTFQVGTTRGGLKVCVPLVGIGSHQKELYNR